MKPFYRDIAVVMALNILSIVFLTLPSLNQYPINFIAYFLLLLFLPGYALLAILDPFFTRTGILRRILLSIILSLIITILFALIPTYTPLKIFNYIILDVLAIFTMSLSIMAVIRRKKFEPPHLSNSKQIPAENPGTPPSKEQDAETKKNPRTRRRFAYLDLIAVLLLVSICMLFVLEPRLDQTVFKTIFGVLLMVFLPGYAFIGILFPKKNSLERLERPALSFGVSIAITPIIGLILYYTPLGINLDPILLVLSGITVFLCVIAFLRRRRIPDENRFRADFPGLFKNLSQRFPGTGKVLSVVVILLLLLFISVPAYNMMKPATPEPKKFTELNIQGLNGTSDNPTNITSGETTTVTIRIVNHENAPTTYRVTTTSNQTIMDEMTVTLQPNETKEIPYSFTAGDPGIKKLDFLLFKLPNGSDVYHSETIWININELLQQSETSDTTSENVAQP